MGRCLRRRKSKNKLSSSTLPDDVKALYKWMTLKSTKIDMSLVALKDFSDSGRGFMARKAVKSGDLIISVPSEFFITTSSISKTNLKSIIQRFTITISPIEALSLFLLYEKYLGSSSEWHPYLEVLPKSFSLPLLWQDEELKYLPQWIARKVEDQKGIILKSFEKIQKLLFGTGEEFGKRFNLDEYIWTWCVINSRSAYMPQPWESWLNHEPNNYVLIPFLDMFNHTTSASVSAGFNPRSKCYEIRTNAAYGKYQQVFINYGNHDNIELLLSYGFVCRRNPFDSINFNLKEVVKATKNVCGLRGNVENKLEFIVKNEYNRNMLISYEGISWSMLNSIKILSILRDVKNDDHFNSFVQEDIVSDRIVSDVVGYLISHFRRLPVIENNNSEIFSFNIFLANQLCLGYYEIVKGVLDSLISTDA